MGRVASTVKVVRDFHAQVLHNNHDALKRGTAFRTRAYECAGKLPPRGEKVSLRFYKRSDKDQLVLASANCRGVTPSTRLKCRAM